MSSLMDKIGGNYLDTPEDAGYSPEAKELINKAFSGIEGNRYLDYHMHILGLGTNDSGIWVSSDLFSLFHPSDSVKTQVYLNTAGIENKEEADTEYLKQLMKFVNHFPVSGKFCLLALDGAYDDHGEFDEKNTKLYIPNEWIFKIYEANKEKFLPCISVNPYRKDALEELEKWAQQGVRMVKWMPANMGMDASDVRCEPFYNKMKEHDMTLLTHAGQEDNVPVTKFQPLNNPLLFRKPLDMGVKVIMAHCASLGSSVDLDNQNKKVNAWGLFLRLMDEQQYEGKLFGDISAITQINRMGAPLKAVLERKDLHHRLINGSDYPLPAMNVLISTRLLSASGYLTSGEVDPLNEIYKINPLLFDFVVKRRIKHPEDESLFFPADIFMHKDEVGVPGDLR